MLSGYEDIVIELKEKNTKFSSLCSQYNALDKAIIQLEHNFDDILELKQLQLDLKEKILLIIRIEKENKAQKHEKTLAMESTCIDWDNLEQDDFAN
ncbi:MULTISPECIES: hypothetical protein [unclassified Photobacterium]|uniref:hypothetical protein n=1 Tax=unclassified Photobacterium TaxID=2628852 RepID=UPI001EDFF128|nr:MULTISPECIES: hypothetical protein [unclassified Photobacterium]MCG3863401.1 hypothetical protein [Photobacterium sp. Ph6]MCG3874930.1 hypothetical protein [Photobacterium sp. Ph5]